MDTITAGPKVKRGHSRPGKDPSLPSNGSGSGRRCNDDITSRPLLTTSRALKNKSKNITTCYRSKSGSAASDTSGPSHDGEMRPRDKPVKEGDDSGGRDEGESAAATSDSGGCRGRGVRGRGLGRQSRLKKKGMSISEQSKERGKVVKEGVATSWPPDCSDGVVATRGGRKRGRAPHGGRGRDRREGWDMTGHKDQPHMTTTPCDDGDSIGLNGQTTPCDDRDSIGLNGQTTPCDDGDSIGLNGQTTAVGVQTHTTGSGMEVDGKRMESHSSGGREEGQRLLSPNVTSSPQAPQRAGDNSHPPDIGRGEKRTLLTTEEAPSSKRACISSGYLRYDVMMR